MPIQDFDDHDKTMYDTTIKAPDSPTEEEALAEAAGDDAASAGDPGNDRDLANKARRQAKEINFETGLLEPVADHLSDPGGDDEAAPDRTVRISGEDGEADGPDRPHVGSARQSATDEPRAKASATRTRRSAKK